MTKKHKSVTFVIIAILTISITTAYFISRRSSDNCQNIVGDGYAMGTDPKPLIIGNTCDTGFPPSFGGR